MFTIVNVLADISGYGDPGWCEPPQGALATTTTAEDLNRDGVKV